jgi:hypothetical protein
MKSGALLLAGLVVLAFGTLFMLQGAGVVHWPRESFMIDDRVWIERGLVVVLIGVGLMLAAWRVRR